MWIKAQRFSLKMETQLKSWSPYTVCKKKKKYLHNPRSTLVTHGQLLCIPHRRPNLCWGGFHASETWRLVGVTYKKRGHKFIRHTTIITTFHIHKNIFNEAYKTWDLHLSPESPEAPWTTPTVEAARQTLGSPAASCRLRNLLRQEASALAERPLMELCKTKLRLKACSPTGIYFTGYITSVWGQASLWWTDS